MNLTDYVKEVSLADFGKPFKHQAVWNYRLRSTGGRFFPKDGHLDFNPRLYDEKGLDIFRKIVRHELCHYHLYFAGRGYKHRDQDFKQLLNKVDGLRYAPILTQKSFLYLYQCQSCGQFYPRQRRLDLRKFSCGCCFGGLQLVDSHKIENQP
ncbi:SprT family protein [Streptococcus dentapri]|uniref:Protein SprT-like n=1 Tax=Streptococcus dentapri TaxID=573564 RepID=A0ABV8D389_9STRE